MPTATGDSKEAVAYALLLGIAWEQEKVAFAGQIPYVKAPKEWVLEHYALCLRIAGGANYASL